MATERGIQLTSGGKEKLEKELRHLRDEKLPELSQRIQDANEDGDVTDNSEYEDLKEDIVHTEDRIREIEHTLSTAIIIEEGSRDGTIGIGSHIIVRASDDDDDEDDTWVLVSAEEADPLKGRISDDSPVGKQLLGKRAGDTFTVKTPVGEATYEVIDVK